MSYQYKRADAQVVVCDACGDYSWVSDPQWRPTRQSSAEHPLHLCPKCRHAAIWCSAHQQYHLPHESHRRACADCGGLFTSVVRDAIVRCPACRRLAGDLPRPAPLPEPKRPGSFVRQLLSFRGSHRH